jgi:hypothetical protein
MAIVFPLDMPSRVGDYAPGRYISAQIELIEAQSSPARTVGGATFVTDYADAFWMGQWDTTDLSREALNIWRAWKSAMKGGRGTFRAMDPLKIWPHAYRNTGITGLLRANGGGFDGTSTIAVIGSDRETVTIGPASAGPTSLPAGFVLGYDDRFNVTRADSSIGYHKITQVVSATNANGRVQVDVAPPLPLDVSTGAVVNFNGPFCLMQVTACDISTSAGNKVRPGKVSLRGMETIQP